MSRVDRKLHGQAVVSAPNGGSQSHYRRQKRLMTVQQALEWAFRTECAQLELPEPPDQERGKGQGYGLEHVLMQRAALGCQIDGGRYKKDSYTNEDAEVIAATVTGMPDDL